MIRQREKSDFYQYLIKINNLAEHGFKRWEFLPGMLFNDVEKWWGDKGLRARPHEGIDIYGFENYSGQTITLNEDTQIPVMYDGKIVHVFDDFLGKTVNVIHKTNGTQASSFHSLYAHVNPLANLEVGNTVLAGEVIGRIAAARVAPHLHISTLSVSKGVSPEWITWESIINQEMVTLYNPFKFLD